MAPPSGAASYKKKEGTLTVAENDQTLTWTPAVTGASTLTISIPTITSMQLSLSVPPTESLCTIANSLAATRPTADLSLEPEGDAQGFHPRTECPAE